MQRVLSSVFRGLCRRPGPGFGPGAGLVLAGALLACGGGAGGGADRIVLVTIDTLRADHLGSYGDLGARTPVLDELAAAGVRFENAIAPTPLTLPSHASLMTGLQPPHHGVRHNSVFALDQEIPVLAAHLREAGFATAAFVGAFVLDGRFGLARGFDVYDDELGERLASESPFSFAERRGDEVVDAALDWLATAPDRFFLWVHLYDPHADYDPPAAFLRRAAGDAYAGEIAFADAQVGRLLRYIGNRWGAAGLVLAVTSDHGESLGEHREATHSYTLYDATQRVPMFLVAPALPKGGVVESPVRLVDLAPTLLWLAAAEPLPGIQGRNLVPLARGSDAAPRIGYLETLATQLDMGWSPLLGVRTATHKYIRAPQPELYDLQEDPGETHNLALERPALVAELDARLDEQLAGARPVEAFLELDAGERARLESLGYVVPTGGSPGEALGVVGGLNPRDHMLEVARVQEARTALAQGRPERALDLLETVHAPGSYVAQTRAEAALAAGRPELALAAMREVRQGGAVVASDLMVLGQAHMALDDVEEARRAFERAREVDPEAHGAYLGLARLAELAGDFEQAERWLLEAEARAPQPQGPRVERAVLRLRQGRVAESDALLEGIGEAFLQEPGRALRLASAEREAGRPDRAAKLLRSAVEAHPHHRDLLSAYASLLESQERFDEALEVRRRAFAQRPEDPAAKNDLAWGLALAGRDLDRALALAGDAAAAMPESPAVLDTLATVRLLRSEPGPALEAAERALAGDPGSLRPHLLYLRAAALEALGRRAEAREALRTLGSGSEELGPPWRERARSLARRLGRTAEAESR